jgi:hypothetical protein
MGNRREPRDMKKTRPEALFAPSLKPRAGFSTRHPSKDAAQPQLRNFAEYPLQHQLGSFVAGPGNASSPNAWRMRCHRPCLNHSS